MSGLSRRSHAGEDGLRAPSLRFNRRTASVPCLLEPGGRVQNRQPGLGCRCSTAEQHPEVRCSPRGGSWSGTARLHSLLPATAVHPPSAQPLVASETKSRVMAKHSDVPLAFERNDGQSDPQVKFLARGHGYTIFLTPSEMVVSPSGSSRAPHTRSLPSPAPRSQPRSLGYSHAACRSKP